MMKHVGCVGVVTMVEVARDGGPSGPLEIAGSGSIEPDGYTLTGPGRPDRPRLTWTAHRIADDRYCVDVAFGEAPHQSFGPMPRAEVIAFITAREAEARCAYEDTMRRFERPRPPVRPAEAARALPNATLARPAAEPMAISPQPVEAKPAGRAPLQFVSLSAVLARHKAIQEQRGIAMPAPSAAPVTMPRASDSERDLDSEKKPIVAPRATLPAASALVAPVLGSSPLSAPRPLTAPREITPLSRAEDKIPAEAVPATAAASRPGARERMRSFGLTAVGNITARSIGMMKAATMLHMPRAAAEVPATPAPVAGEASSNDPAERALRAIEDLLAKPA